MENKNSKTPVIVLAIFFGIVFATGFRIIEHQLQKPADDYFFALTNILCGIIILACAFTEKFKENLKSRKKLLILGGLVSVYGLALVILQVI